MHLVAGFLEVEDVGATEGEFALTVERAELSLGNQSAQVGRCHLELGKRLGER